MHINSAVLSLTMQISCCVQKIFAKQRHQQVYCSSTYHKCGNANHIRGVFCIADRHRDLHAIDILQHKRKKLNINLWLQYLGNTSSILKTKSSYTYYFIWYLEIFAFCLPCGIAICCDSLFRALSNDVFSFTGKKQTRILQFDNRHRRICLLSHQRLSPTLTLSSPRSSK